jgi:hypothetical protein
MSGENAPTYRILVLYQSLGLGLLRQEETVSEIFILISTLMRMNFDKTLLHLFSVIVSNFTKLIVFSTGEKQLLFFHIFMKIVSSSCL